MVLCQNCKVSCDVLRGFLSGYCWCHIANKQYHFEKQINLGNSSASILHLNSWYTINLLRQIIWLTDGCLRPVFHSFLSIMAGGSGSSSSVFPWGNLFLFSWSQQPRPTMLMHTWKWRRSLPPHPILGSFIPKNCLSAASYYSFLYAIMVFRVFFPLQGPLQRIFSFSVFSFLCCSVCLLVTIVPSPNGSGPGQRSIPCGATSGTPVGTWEWAVWNIITSPWW